MNWDAAAAESRAVLEHVYGPLRLAIEQTAAEMVGCLRAGGKVLCCGNGGSAADAQHLAAELVNRFLLNRRPYAGLALTTDTSVLTSVGNDFGFEQAFEKQVQALGRRGDLLVGFSTSGNAENVLRAFAAAREAGLRTLAITGGTGGRLAAVSDRVLSIACTRHTPRIQEGHLYVLHLLCEIVEAELAKA
jgi:D-sedoheptulose 7-phosphate isomerase